jgi:hypothetical protein
MADRAITRREFMRRAGGVALGGAALGSAGLLAACTSPGTKAVSSVGTAPPLHRDPNTLVLAVDAWTADFDPASAVLVPLAVSAYGMYEGLVRMKAHSATEVEPVLAERWKANADHSVWTFELRRGVRYSDGTPFDADALKAAFARTIEVNLGSSYILGTPIAEPDKQIVVRDPGTVVFDLGSGVPRFDLLLASQYGCLVVNPNVRNMGHHLGHEYLLDHSAGTGAYMVESFEPSDKLVLTRNPNYWRGWNGSHFDTVIIQQVEEGAVRREGIESGDFDLAYASTPQDSDALRHTPGIVVGDELDVGMEYIILGQYGPLASPAARRAMNLLFPHDQFLDSVMKGALTVPSSVLPDLMLYSDKGTYPRTTDVDKAKQLLQQAGVRPGTELTYEYYPGFRKEPGLVLQQQLAEARREGVPGVLGRPHDGPADRRAGRHVLLVVVARLQRPVGLLLPDPVVGGDAEGRAVQHRLLRQLDGDVDHRRRLHRDRRRQARVDVAGRPDDHGHRGPPMDPRRPDQGPDVLARRHRRLRGEPGLHSDVRLLRAQPDGLTNAAVTRGRPLFHRPRVSSTGWPRRVADPGRACSPRRSEPLAVRFEGPARR